nr:MAG: ORF1 [TTV-like mini virus]
MPPFQRRFNYYWRRRPYFQRRKYRQRRPRRGFRRYRRRAWVRKRHFRKRKQRKLKYIKLNQWQPLKIRKCRITGFLELFETAYGRVSNNWVATKESFIPPHQPGGGGWSIQQLTLGNLYVQNVYCMNYWSKSNRGYNLCRYFGVRIDLYRQDNVDWIFTYDLEEPLQITKYTYASYHPSKLLQYNKKIVIPSFQTAPHKKKKYYRKFIRPPKKLTNQWYFQNHLQNTPLLTFFATACSLQKMFISKTAKNNNVTLWTLNTKFFKHPRFQYKLMGTQPFSPDTEGKQTLWGIHRPSEPIDKNKIGSLTLLGAPALNDIGNDLNSTTSATSYTSQHWGNPFYFTFLTEAEPVYLLQNVPSGKTAITYLFEMKQKEVSDPSITGLARKFEPLVVPVRYNPNKDKGIGNKAYFVKTNDKTKKDWEPPQDSDLVIENFPLWLMLWGFQDYILRYNKITNLNENGLLVIRSPYFNEPFPAYVFLSDYFVNGQGPYGVDRDEINLYERGHWYPRWEFQKEAIEDLLMSGPAVSRPQLNESIQSHMKYQFFFKWGGNPSTMETVIDPNIQPVIPDPTSQLLNNEIVSPTTSIENFIYNWDTRRDTLTQAATKRIIQIPTNDEYVFTDGTTTTTDIPLPKKAKIEETEPSEEEETQVLQQLLLLQQHNQQLKQRFRQLKTIMDNL